MNIHIHTANRKSIGALALLIALFSGIATSPSALGTSLSSTPLANSPVAAVLPNVFLMMDDSGSMGWDYMPDNAKDFGTDTYGAASSQCNGVYYDPSLTYSPPVDSTGLSYPNSTYTNAWNDGYNTAGSKTNLNTNFSDTAGTSTGAAYYYKYTGTQTTEKLKDYYNTSSTFYKECNSTVGSAPGNAVFTKVMVGAAEQQNFANWYSYYRTRMLTMKTATGLAFKTIGDTFRVGFATMNNNNAGDYLDLDTFDATHKAAWYKKLYSAKPANMTPLREALSNVGRLYAMKLPSGKLNGVAVVDPIQYSCQQNFTILTTDGFWNGSTTYDLNGTAVGNQDGNEPRPMYDGAQQQKSTTQILQTQVRTDRTTSQVQQWTQQTQARTSVLQTQTSRLQEETGILQSRTSDLQKRTGILQGTLSKILMQCNDTALACGTAPASGIPDFQWSIVNSGSCTVSSNVQCKVINLSGVVDVATTCSAGAITSSTATAATATVKFSSSSSAKITSIKINGQEILSGSTTSSSTNSTVASRTATNINNCTAAPTGSCTVSGYSATVSGSTVTITPPAGVDITALPSVSKSGTVTITRSFTSNTPEKHTLANPDSNGNIYSACAYATTGWTNATGACNTNISLGAPYTVLNSTECQYTTWSSWTSTGSCTPAAQNASGGQLTATQCQYVFTTSGKPACDSTPAYVAGDYSNATVYRNCQTTITSPYSISSSACVATTIPDGSGNTTQCRYWNNATNSTWTPWANANTCTPVAQDFTNLTAKECQVTNTSPTWVGVQTCTPAGTPPSTFDATGKLVQCQTATTGPTPVDPTTCTGTTAASAGNSWTQTNCTNVTVAASQGVTSCTAAPANAGNGWVKTTCTTNSTGPTNIAGCIAETASASNNWITTVCTAGTGGTSNTLADVAEYYYVNDLRTPALGNNLSGAPGTVLGTDISKNNVPTSTLDKASHQHMTTFTLGLGARGRMIYDPSYQTATDGDFFSVKSGSTANPSVGVCSWQTSGACNWPTPASNAIENIDDLWHAAVNGRGTYFSAANPQGLSMGLSTALGGVSARRGSAAAATTSTAFITQGDNYLFHSGFVTLDWSGEFTRQQIDIATVTVNPSPDWSAHTLLDAKTYTSRNIYMFDSSVPTTKLAPFNWANVSAAYPAPFSLANLSSLAQFCASGAVCLSATDQSLAAGANLVNYIRGDRSNEGALADNTKFYRQRSHLLGDIVNSEAKYVKGSSAMYSDAGFDAHKATIATRKGMVYVGANDGMLHAFDATTGNEDWAFIPSAVIPNLFKLANKAYGLNHQYYVDGSPVSAEICISSCGASGAVWKTILIGGLNYGGKSYYALDVTDPANPKALWEFTNANLGYSYGNPTIVKLKDGTWVALLTSGYNNVGDGQGHLFVLNAYTGALITNISTGVGSAGVPSGLARISAPVATPGVDATGLMVYGGDELGNLWRFDINNDIGAAGYDAQLLATLADGLGNPQPITSRPLVSIINNTYVVYVGTGRYLGVIDQTDSSQQSFYAIKDNLPGATTPGTAIYGNPRTNGNFVQQTMTTKSCPVNSPADICAAGEAVVVASNNAVDFSSDNGWYFDFPVGGERANTDPAIQKGTLVFTTNLPSSESCVIGGESFLYFIDFRTGSSVSSSPTGVVNRKVGNELSSNVQTMTVEEEYGCVQGSGGGDPRCFKTPPNEPVGESRRVSWRELISE